MSQNTSRVIKYLEANQRLDRWIRRNYENFPQSRIEKLCRKGKIKIDNKRAKPSDRLEEGQQITLPPMNRDDEKRTIESKKEPLNSRKPDWLKSGILHIDDDLIILNKPQGLAVQGGTKQAKHIDNLVTTFFSGPDGAPRLVHRLDKDTSGVMVMARNRRAAAEMAKGFRSRKVHKTYLAIVHGTPKKLAGRIESKNQKPNKDGKKSGKAKFAITEYEVLENIAKYAALVRLNPITGRTHQLRIHMAEIGHPIIGDQRYGTRKGGLMSGSLMLHAELIQFDHPLSGKEIRIQAPLPKHMLDKFRQIGWDERDVLPN